MAIDLNFTFMLVPDLVTETLLISFHTTGTALLEKDPTTHNFTLVLEATSSAVVTKH